MGDDDDDNFNEKTILTVRRNESKNTSNAIARRPRNGRARFQVG